MKFALAICSSLLFSSLFSQESDSLIVDSLSKATGFQFHMGFDWYYAINHTHPKVSTMPYFVSFSQNRELQQNLIFADLKLEKKRYRAHLVPAIGTFMEQNSAPEKGIFKNLLEANIGIRPFRKKDIWIDGGVLGSPYTNETPFSQDHLTLTRSLAAEYVPYYLAGARASWQISKKWKVCLFALNGWQQITDQNDSKSLGTQIEFKPSDRDLLNWNTYVGKEGKNGHSSYGMRYFSDVYWTHGFSERLSIASCAYAGIQRNSQVVDQFWWQANTAIRYSMNKLGSWSLRAEYFNDPDHAVVQSLAQGNPFRCISYSFGYGYHILSSMLFRVEYRKMQSTSGLLYFKGNSTSVESMEIITAALSFWF
jgi:hypothetical protein